MTSPTPPSSHSSTPSSASSSSSTTLKTSSPLNPKRALARSPQRVSELEGLEGIPEPSTSSKGSVVITHRRSVSQPLLTLTSSPVSTLTALPTQQESGFLELTRTHSKSSERVDESVWRKKINDILGTPKSGMSQSLASSWWEKQETPKKRKHHSPDEEYARSHAKKVSCSYSSFFGRCGRSAGGCRLTVT